MRKWTRLIASWLRGHVKALATLGLGINFTGALLLYYSISPSNITAMDKTVAWVNTPLARHGFMLVAVGFFIQLLSAILRKGNTKNG